MKTENCVVTPMGDTGCFKCISWSAVVVGALVATGLGFLLYLLTAGLGLSAVTTSSSGMIALAVGTFIWLFLTSYFTMFIAGFITALLARPVCSRPSLGLLHGFLAWTLALLISIFAHSTFFGASIPEGQLTNRTTTQTTVNTVNKVSQVNLTNPQVTPSTEEASNKLGIGVLATFFIFLIGALGATTGGYFGTKSLCKDKFRDVDDLDREI